ncbi:PadR family transcriptional regulator, partial [Klebsiella pneumoniae]
MDSQLKKGIIEFCVLAFLQRGDSYGYEIVKNIAPLLPISESTLYPILK